ncbi:type II toxin-antitoxin system VapC family toxin [Nakamurella sp. PAMC28650]|uniref:type II toxin-antitoxin system VapC family toxin n=1 Tax=Nakamurella sp. PAMC28650 TaxID=2762325 RepID=UPI00164DAFD5|nr:type II toxin-antitoxin system VapC family toxin [Nakamurella sp. PAMC28650]QNK81320.1 type II toxin-antitoxin system VapC family toxin [Nakamurella sp. PAMC28650]
MIVVDASAALSALLNDGTARQALADERVHAPHLIDSEAASGLRQAVSHSLIDAGPGWTALHSWRRLGLSRYAVHPLLERIWELRDNLSAYDAGYVALAESLDCALITADAKLAQATGSRCPVTVVPR